MATTKDVERLPSGKLKYRGEIFPGYNKPKRLSGESKKSAVLAKKGDEIKVVRYGDPNMAIRKDNPAARKSFRARHRCDTAKDKFTARYWSCKAWQPKYQLSNARYVQEKRWVFLNVLVQLVKVYYPVKQREKRMALTRNAKTKVKKVIKALNKASKTHAGQAKTLKNVVNKNASKKRKK